MKRRATGPSRVTWRRRWTSSVACCCSARDIKRACAVFQESLDVFGQMRAAGRITQLDEDTIIKDVRQQLTKNCADKATALAR